MGSRLFLLSQQQQLTWDSVSQRPLTSPNTRQVEFPAIPQMAGVQQVQAAQCLSPGLLIEDGSPAYVTQRESNRVAESFMGIQPCSVSSCALPQHTSLTSPQDSERAGLVHLLRPGTKWHLLVFAHRPLHERVKKKIKVLWFFTIEPSAFGDWLSYRQNIQFPQLGRLRTLFSRNILQIWYVRECTLASDVSFKSSRSVKYIKNADS